VTKKRLNLRIDEEVAERAKQQYNVSKVVREYLDDLVCQADSKEDRIEEINDEIKEHKDVISERQRKISNLQSEKSILEKKLNEEAQTTSEKVRFFRIAKRNIEDNSWSSPDDIPSYWRGKFDETIEELWKLAKNSDAEPADAKKKSSTSSTSVNVV